MKKVTLLIIGAGILISVCMIYLFRHGISLRAATLIKPSFIDEGYMHMTQGVVYRLFPDFQTADLIVVSGDLNSSVFQTVSAQLKTQAEDVVKRTFNGDSWQIAETAAIHPDAAVIGAGVESAAIPKKITLSVVEFEDYDASKISMCEQQKFLTFECLKTLGIKEAQRKMKDKNKKYFFLKKYNHSDYFLFIQKTT